MLARAALMTFLLVPTLAVAVGEHGQLPEDLRPLRCIAASPLERVCDGLLDAAVGQQVEFNKVGRIPVDIFSDVRGQLGACQPDDVICGLYTAEVEGERIYAVAVSAPVVVIGSDPLGIRI